VNSRSPKQRGSAVEGAIIQKVPELTHATADHWDAITTAAVHDIETFQDLDVDRDTEIEIKSAAVVISGDRCGRFYLREQQHEALLEKDGWYLFTVAPPHDIEPLAMRLVPARIVDEMIDTWVIVEDRAPFKQFAWSQFIEPSEVNR